MGVTYVEGVAEGPGGRSQPIRFLVDSGAKYTLLPHEVWMEIGIESKRTLEFVLADGTIVKRDVSECRLVLPQGDGWSPVILGEPGDSALLGVVTLEVLGLMLDPFNRTLHPMRMTLA